ncbi:MAG TPA: PEP-CTERM sorting domain-containing protein [Bryobacteraceae bacterium]
MRRLSAVAALFLLPAGAALAATATTDLFFSGVCSDCASVAHATLTVTGFTPGEVFTLDLSNFVQFSYEGTNIRGPFVITPSDNPIVSGSLGPSFPNPYPVSVSTPDTIRAFASQADGSWAVSSGQGPDDFGAVSSYSLTAAPEPATMAIAAAALLALAVARRFNTRSYPAC